MGTVIIFMILLFCSSFLRRSFSCRRFFRCGFCRVRRLFNGSLLCRFFFCRFGLAAFLQSAYAVPKLAGHARLNYRVVIVFNLFGFLVSLFFIDCKNFFERVYIEFSRFGNIVVKVGQVDILSFGHEAYSRFHCVDGSIGATL